MFTRVVRMHLKPDSKKGFVQAIDNEAIPALKKFAGFEGEVAMVSSDGKEAIGISLWDRKEHAEIYNQKGYAGVLKSLAKYTEGKPELRTYEVTNSTIATLPIRKAA